MQPIRARVIPGELPNRCTLRFTDYNGDVRERDFFAPPGGGYVREDWSNPRQVCERLYQRGATLIWDAKLYPTLAALIRRERKRATDASARVPF